MKITGVRSVCFLGTLLWLFLLSPLVHGEMKKLDRSDLRTVSGQEGLSFDVDVDVTADFLEFSDQDGRNLGNGNGSAGALRFADLNIGNGTTLTGASLDVDDAGTLEFDFPGGAFPAYADDVVLPATPEGQSPINGPVAGRISLQQINLGNAELDFSGSNSGLTLDGNLGINIGSLHLEDEDGNTDYGRGLLLFQDIVLGTSFDDDFSGLTLDADSTNGLVVGMPGDNLSFEVGTVCIETAQDIGGCSFVDNIASDIALDNLDLAGTEFQFDGNNGGLTFDGAVKFEFSSLSLDDPDGTPDNSGTEGTIDFEDVRFTDASNSTCCGNSGGGDPVTIDSEGAVHVDGDGGLVIEAPTFDTTGDGESAHDYPDNELFIHNINVDGSCSGDRCGSWGLRNFDPGGSWVKVSGR